VLIAVLAARPARQEGRRQLHPRQEQGRERARADAGRGGALRRQDDKGQKFEITANRAIQRSSDVPIVDISGMFARLALAQGPLMIAANQGRYNLDTQKVASTARCGRRARRLPARDPRRDVDLKQRDSCQRRPGRGPDAARPVPGGAAARRSRRAQGGARRRRSLENRARGGQMMAMRALASSLHCCWLLAASRRRGARQQRRAAGLGAQGPQQQRSGRRHRRPDRGPGPRRPRDLRRQRPCPPGRADARHARLTVAYSSGRATSGVQIRRLDAAGGVVVRSPSETAAAISASTTSTAS
jgi:hypothetical protein